MSNSKNKEDVVGYECRFSVFCPPPEQERDDLHLIKEIVHYKDGTTEPRVRLKKNFQRPFWITKKGRRNHSDKKEWEYLDSVIKFECRQSELVTAISRALGQPWFRGEQRKLFRSPYIYGADILSTAVIKRSYQDKWPNLITPYSMSAYDIETDVLYGTGEIIMGTLSYKNRVVTAIKKSFLEGQSDVLDRLQAKLKQYLGPYVEKRNIKWEVVLVDNESDIVVEVFKRAHAWKPDFVAIWNIDFDMPKSLKALEKANIDPKNVFSDPIVPPQFRHFKYKQGPKQKVTASGKVTPIKPAAQWHTAYCPSSFYFIDAMCAYKHIRTGQQEKPSYSLDAILQEHLGIRKLKFEEANGFTGLDWHQFMQANYPLEYVIYNVFDCVSMEELDESTSDLSTSLPMFSGCSDFENFKSQPRRLADNLHYFALENGKVFGTTSDEMANELDKETLGLDGWIVTLPAHLVVDNGLKIIEENSLLPTNVRGHVGDLDVSASYPNGGAVFNISKETTHREMCRILGISEHTQRMQSINLSGGATNAVEFCTAMYGLPNMETMLAAFEQSRLLKEGGPCPSSIAYTPSGI